MGLDAAQIIKNIYDPTQNALRIRVGSADAAVTGQPGAEQTLKLEYSAADKALKVLNVGAPSGTSGTTMSWQQVLKKVFDKPTGKMRGVL